MRKGLLHLEGVSLARVEYRTSDLLRGQNEGIVSHDTWSRATPLSLPIWTPQPLQHHPEQRKAPNLSFRVSSIAPTFPPI